MWARSYAFPLLAQLHLNGASVLYTVFLCAYFKLFLLYLVISFCPNYHLLKLLLLLFLLGPFFIVFIEFTTILFLFLCFDFLAAGSQHPQPGTEHTPLHCQKRRNLTPALPEKSPVIISNCEFPKLFQVLSSNCIPFVRKHNCNLF